MRSWPGPNSSNALYLTNVSGTLFFTAVSGGARELWKTDGTEAGTAVFNDVIPGAEGSAPAMLFESDGKLYFSAEQGSAASTQISASSQSLAASASEQASALEETSASLEEPSHRLTGFFNFSTYSAGRPAL